MALAAGTFRPVARAVPIPGTGPTGCLSGCPGGQELNVTTTAKRSNATGRSHSGAGMGGAVCCEWGRFVDREWRQA